jgi:glycolate oxidase iron-sulfur subunit
MQTQFSARQLEDGATAAAESVIRRCVHCGFCLATCPTYQLLGDELDSPRGRIYLIKDMLENERQPTATVVKHVDRCLSCLACMSTCPSEVHYMHLVDHARAYIERRFRRPWSERLARALLAWVLPHPERMRRALRLSRLMRPATPLIARVPALRPLLPMLQLTPPRAAARAFAIPSKGRGVRRGRVALLQGCVESVLRPQIRAATVRLLNRCGFDVMFAASEVCCGALVHHLGKEQDALTAARSNVDAWSEEFEARGLDAIVATASGCGTMIKDYGFLLRGDAAYAARAARIAALVRDVTELPIELTGRRGERRRWVVAYHSACSLQHGQKVTGLPPQLLEAAGFVVRTPSESHLCCGSAGTYNLLQPQIASQLGARKVAHLERTQPDVIATGNIGCMLQIGQRTAIPVVHTVELLDWASGGPAPAALAHWDAPPASK